MNVQRIAEDSEGEDGYGQGVAAIVRVLEDLGDDLVVVFCLRLVRMVGSLDRWTSCLVSRQC